MPYYDNQGNPTTEQAYMAQFDPKNGLNGLKSMLVKQADARNNAAIDKQMMDDVAAANEKQSGVLNQAALANSRRQAGGTTFRRRGSSVSANQLVGGLGAANAKSLAAQRRALAHQQAVNAPMSISTQVTGGFNTGTGSIGAMGSYV